MNTENVLHKDFFAATPKPARGTRALPRTRELIMGVRQVLKEQCSVAGVGFSAEA
jgi:hypothetical protein